MSYFSGAQAGVMESTEVDSLKKALEAGYATDSAAFTGGRALIPEDLESDVVNVIAETKEDCKIINSVKKTPMKSTVHEVTLRTDEGDWKHTSVREGGSSVDSSQSLQRKTFKAKYLQCRRSVTLQMEASETLEGAYTSEKLAGINTIIKASEYQAIHGNSEIVDAEMDGLIHSIRSAPSAERNILSLRGATVGSYGEKLFEEMAAMTAQKGGNLDKALFPLVIAKDIKEMFADKQRYIMNQPLPNLSFKSIPDYGTSVGANIALSGDDAGADKFYQVKRAVAAEGDATKRPAAPTSVTVSANTSVSGSMFASADAGDYLYAVHAVNEYGISAAVAPAAAVTVAAGGSVTITITPGSGVQPTGFIITRSKADGTELMEMDQVKNSGDSTTVYTDKNEELPGTASMLLLGKNRLSQPIIRFGQLMPVCAYPLSPVDKAEKPFLVLMFGGLQVLAPKQCGLVKDISYTGGLY